MLAMLVGKQLLGCPAVRAGVMRRRRKVAQVRGARVKHARRATEEQDRECKRSKSAHHQYGNGPVVATSSGQSAGPFRHESRIFADHRGSDDRR
jgi:hypothetical protein